MHNARNLLQIFAVFLRLGLTSFGGPVAHLGYFRAEFVERRKWLSDADYADLVALCQFLPGPASSQMGIAIGLLRGGHGGALLAWLGFTLPSAVLMLAVASGIGWFEGPVAIGALHGLKLAALAVVAQAVWAMAASLAPDWPRRAVALAAATVALLLPAGIAQIGILAVAGAAGAILAPPALRAETPAARPSRASLIWFGLFLGLLVALPLLASGGDPLLVAAEKFYRTGSLVFGGGHVVLPLLEAELVRPGLVDRDLFLAGYGAVQAVPGPLFSFAAYAGALLKTPPNGLAGATLGLCAIYLPSFLLVFAAIPWWRTLRANGRLRAVLSLANAAVVGLLLAVLWDPVFTGSVGNGVDLAWAALALAALLWRAPPWLVVLLSGALGIAVALL